MGAQRPGAAESTTRNAAASSGRLVVGHDRPRPGVSASGPDYRPSTALQRKVQEAAQLSQGGGERSQAGGPNSAETIVAQFKTHIAEPRDCGGQYAAPTAWLSHCGKHLVLAGSAGTDQAP